LVGPQRVAEATEFPGHVGSGLGVVGAVRVDDQVAQVVVDIRVMVCRLPAFAAADRCRYGREQTGRRCLMARRNSPRFVIQMHDASSLHYDFRLEVDGVLKSWAIPKGPSLDPREKRLAVQVEDHQLDYYDFEGVIGGGYGKGTVLVWDAGTYRNLDEDHSMAEALDAGHVKVWLEGKKLTGGWTLQRTRGGFKPQWLMIKRRDEGADARRNPESTQPNSVTTGRTLEQITADEEAGQ
jgi:DNA ligase D-like protein (predicted 3'-phosphoesterase)